MTGTEMQGIRESMHLPVRALARCLDRGESNVREMESGERAIPAQVAALGRWRKNHPPPKKTR